jgi:competence protein ComEA
MWKKFLLVGAILSTSAHLVFAQVDVNQADQAALESIKGIGPKTSRAIVEERQKAGPFKDWADFSARIHGIGSKKTENLSKAGLTLHSQTSQVKASQAVPPKTIAEISWSKPPAPRADQSLEHKRLFPAR